MKVLLCEDVKTLGWLGDVVQVPAGYARNYLLPQGLAVIPTEANLKSLSKEAARHTEQRALESERLKETAAAVQGAEAVVAAKANEQGVLFGSVGAREIAANLREQGFEVADDVVAMSGHIKEVGTHSVSLKFAPDLSATVSVVVVATGEDITSVPAEGGPEQGGEDESTDQDT